jgi:phosphatidylglycerophosphate synthase
MSKLTANDKFLDLSDYGRSLGTLFAKQLKDTRFTPIHVTLLFGLSGLLACFCILKHQLLLASIFIILKSVIDAADGELARLKKTPSYTGRYLDSVFDIILNGLFFSSISYISKTNLTLTFIAFCCLQLQGTLYNYYYVILRNKSINGDSTSKIFEYKTPKALPGEKQKWVNVLFVIYTIVYGVFDKIIHFSDKEAYKALKFPNWFMTFVSIYGLGFQLLIIAVMLTFQLTKYIIPFFIMYSVFIFVLIFIRKKLLHPIK